MARKVDGRDNLKPGAKYFEWERKGVPLRFEVGPRDVANRAVFAASRLGGGKFGIPFAEGFATTVETKLAEIQATLLARATERRDANTHTVATYDEFKTRIEGGGFYLVNWCDDAENEAKIKEETKATIRCYPIGKQDITGPCFYSGRPATHVAIFAKAY